MGPKGYDLHTPESTANMPVNQVSWSHSKAFLKKWPKTSETGVWTILLCT